jgi:branched-chain amino acid transport system substrate-binding protein
LDLSGAAADVGKDALAGAQYAVDFLNSNGGILGRQVVLDYQDGGSNPQRAMNEATALARSGAVMLLSPQSSSSAIAVSKGVSGKLKVPTCVGQSIADDLTIKDFQPFIFSVTPTSFMEGRALASRFAKLPYKRYALLSADYAGGRAGVKRFKEFLLELNPNTEIVVEDYPKFGATDYTATINKVLAAKPDYVFSILFGADLLTFSKQANSVGFFKQVNNRFIALYDFNTLKALGSNAPVGTEGWQRAPANYLSQSMPQAEKFIVTYKAKTGSYPSDWTLMSYDCVMNWAHAVSIANSTDAEPVMRAIESASFESSRGRYRFAKYDHEANVPIYVGRIEESKAFGQPVLRIDDVIPGESSHPGEAVVNKLRNVD